jgi:hypothetical protein
VVDKHCDNTTVRFLYIFFISGTINRSNMMVAEVSGFAGPEPTIDQDAHIGKFLRLKWTSCRAIELFDALLTQFVNEELATYSIAPISCGTHHACYVTILYRKYIRLVRLSCGRLNMNSSLTKLMHRVRSSPYSRKSGPFLYPIVTNRHIFFSSYLALPVR